MKDIFGNLILFLKKDDTIFPEGKYTFVEDEIYMYSKQINVYIDENKSIFRLDEKGELLDQISKEDLNDFSHYCKYEVGLDIKNTHVEYQREIKYKSYYSEKYKTTVYEFKDCKSYDFIIFKNDKNNICFETLDIKPLCIKDIGWKTLILPENFSIYKTVELNTEDVNILKNLFQFFQENKELPDFLGTDFRGFKDGLMFDVNDAEIRISESSACGYRLWFGHINEKISYNNKNYTRDSFCEGLKNNDFSEINKLNKTNSFNKLLITSDFEVSHFYMKPIIEVLEILSKND